MRGAAMYRLISVSAVRVLGVLGQPPIAHLDEAPQPLEDVEGVLQSALRRSSQGLTPLGRHMVATAKVHAYDNVDRVAGARQ